MPWQDNDPIGIVPAYNDEQRDKWAKIDARLSAATIFGHAAGPSDHYCRDKVVVREFSNFFQAADGRRPTWQGW